MKKSDELLGLYRSNRDEASSDFFGFPGIDAYDTHMGHDLAWSSSADLFAGFWLTNNPPS